MVALVWAVLCAAMVLIGVRALTEDPKPREVNADPPLTDGLTPRTGVLMILSGTLLGLPLFAFAFWGLATLVSGGP